LDKLLTDSLAAGMLGVRGTPTVMINQWGAVWLVCVS
jgi:hypothetical protein